MAGCVGMVEVPASFLLGAAAGTGSLGRWDPCVRVSTSLVGRATRTPDGPASAWYRLAPSTRTVTVEAWGPGAEWLVARAPALLGGHDDLTGFAALVAGHRLLARLHRERPGLRFGRTGRVVEALLPTVCTQKVTGLEAKRAWRGLVARFGDPAPGPGGLSLPPDPARLAAAGYADLHRLGLERRRAETVLAVARDAAALDRQAGGDAEAAGRRLRAVPGVGVWSEAEVRRIAFGDADAVSYGDYHLPHLVAWALAGRRRGTDALMAELLAPFAPHRGRVVRLLELARLGPPRRGPRLAPSGMEGR